MSSLAETAARYTIRTDAKRVLKEGPVMSIPENVFSNLTDEQKKKIQAARSPEDLLALAKEAGYELSDEQLVAVSGGGETDGSWCSKDCPFCQHGSCASECTRYYPCGDYCEEYFE